MLREILHLMYGDREPNRKACEGKWRDRPIWEDENRCDNGVVQLWPYASGVNEGLSGDEKRRYSWKPVILK